MKKLGMFVMTLALLVPMAALTTGPAGAAAAGTKCKAPSGKLAFAPGVGATLKVQTISINLPISGCVGGGVTGGTFKGTLKTQPLDLANISKTASNLKFTVTITWNTKKTSTFTATSKTTIGTPIKSTVSGKISKGLFAGLTFSSAQTVTYSLVGGVIKVINLKGTGAITIK